MKVLSILTYPDPKLRQISKKVETFDRAFQKTIDSVMHTMAVTENTAGLAAPQVGILQRFFIMDAYTTGSEDLALINPVILEVSRETTNESEGCLSVPGGITENVVRPKRIKGQYQTRDGTLIEFENDEFFARCFQHELDHLNGKLFIDHLSTLKRQRVDKKLQKFKRDQKQ